MVDNKELQLESQISAHFTKDNGVTTHFRHEEIDGDKIRLEVYTFNHRTNVNFLFYQTNSSTYLTGLSKTFNYMKEVMPDENIYTVFWERKKVSEKQETPKINQSYFRGIDIGEVVDKFYEGKNREEIEITGVELNPIS